MNFLLLGIDSLIACVAVGALVDRRSWAWFAALFGIADAGGFLIGVGLGWGLMSEAASQVIVTGTFVLLGIYLLAVAAGTARMTARWAIWVLPLALTVDNLTFGLFVAAWLPRMLPGRVAETRVAGAALLVGAGALFIVG